MSETIWKHLLPRQSYLFVLSSTRFKGKECTIKRGGIYKRAFFYEILTPTIMSQVFRQKTGLGDPCPVNPRFSCSN
jgi:hypothetical protein